MNSKYIFLLVLFFLFLMYFYIYVQVPDIKDKRPNVSKTITVEWYNKYNERKVKVVRSEYIDFVNYISVPNSAQNAIYFTSAIFKKYSIIKYEFKNLNGDAQIPTVSDIKLDSKPTESGKVNEKDVKLAKSFPLKMNLYPNIPILNETSLKITLLFEE